MTQVIVILNKKGEILDFSPRDIDPKVFLTDALEKEIYDDGELIRKLYVKNK